MKHIFILNPAAGKGKVIKTIYPEIVKVCKEKKLDYEIHRTISLGDARNYTRKSCRVSNGKLVRFYSCGGDGTLNEVLNGLIGFDNAELAVIPSGTGNDFVRNFDGWRSFRDIEKQIDGHTIKIDSIKYELLDLKDEDLEFYDNVGIKTTGYALNMFNLGFDAQAVAKAAEMKKKPFISGTLAYVAGVLSVLIKLKSIKVDMVTDNGDDIKGNYTLIGIANGRFSGGGFDGSPYAKLDDGFLDVSLINRITRRFFLSFVKSYHDGTHVDSPHLEGVYKHMHRKEVVLRPRDKVIMAIDGETIRTGPVKFNVIPNSVRLVLPEGIDYDQDKD